jgi:carbon storage regulator
MKVLVLSRHKQESVILILPDGAEVEVTLCDVRGDRARIGFAAPQDVKILRREIYEQQKPEPPKAA